jgi:hypothetical protein
LDGMDLIEAILNLLIYFPDIDDHPLRNVFLRRDKSAQVLQFLSVILDGLDVIPNLSIEAFHITNEAALIFFHGFLVPGWIPFIFLEGKIYPNIPYFS